MSICLCLGSENGGPALRDACVPEIAKTPPLLPGRRLEPGITRSRLPEAAAVKLQLRNREHRGQARFATVFFIAAFISCAAGIAFAPCFSHELACVNPSPRHSSDRLWWARCKSCISAGTSWPWPYCHTVCGRFRAAHVRVENRRLPCRACR